MNGLGQVTATAYSRSEACLRLSELTVDSEEARKLQRALMKTVGIVGISFPHESYKADTCAVSLRGGFRPHEQVTIDKEITLELTDKVALLKKGAIPLTFGSIVALAGDLYALVAQESSLSGGYEVDRVSFQSMFDKLRCADDRRVRKMIDQVHQPYERAPHLRRLLREYSVCLMNAVPTTKKMKRQVDPFEARHAYSIGHQLARETAQEAGLTNDLEKLKMAYAIDAMACYFLIELFSAGNMRNPRKKLELFLQDISCLSATLARQLADLLAAAQYLKDGDHGLNVENNLQNIENNLQNDQKRQWRAYSDDFGEMTKNSENWTQAICAIQHSVDEVYQAFQSPQNLLSSEVLDRTPRLKSWNPSPVYSLNPEGTRLGLHRGKEMIAITETTDPERLVSQVVQQALCYLPENTPVSFIQDYPMADLATKAVPQIYRLVETIWEILGLKDYAPLKRQEAVLTDKIEQLTQQLAELPQQIGQLSKEIDQQWTDLKLADILPKLRELGAIDYGIAQIKDHLLFTNSQGEQIEERLKKGYFHIEDALVQRNLGGNIMPYALGPEGNLSLGSKDQACFDEDEKECCYFVTLLFRQILTQQILLFQLYQIRKIFLRKDEGLLSEALAFEGGLLSEIQTNRDCIDLSLVCEEPHYIKMKLCNSKIQRKATYFYEEKQIQVGCRALVPDKSPSYCSQKNRDRTDLELHLERIAELFLRILAQPVLCCHDVNDLNQIYHLMDRRARIALSPSEQISSLLRSVIKRIGTALSSGNTHPGDFISVYHLQNFSEECGADQAFARLKEKVHQLETEKKVEAALKVALKMPFCVSAEQFKQDREELIGDKYSAEVHLVMKQKENLLVARVKQRQEIEQAQLLQGQSAARSIHSTYLEEILERGYLSLYNHLIEMQTLKDRYARLEACQKISFSDLSRIVLEVREAIVKTVEEGIPTYREGAAIFFLLGTTGAGKSTALAFLRGDKMVLQGVHHLSQGADHEIISDSLTHSATFLPNIETCKYDQIYVDFPGFDDTNGPLVSIGIELAIKRLTALYQPKIIVFQSITGKEDRYRAASELGRRLKRLFAKPENCILGLTKYSHGAHFQRIREIEERTRGMLASLDREIADIKKDIQLLESLSQITEPEDIEAILTWKRKRLSVIEEERQRASQGHLAEKASVEGQIEEIEQAFLRETGLRQLIRFVDLERPDRLQELFHDLFASKLGPATLRKKMSLEPSDRHFLEERFEKSLMLDLNAKKDHPLDFDNFEQFTQRLFETSLTNIITPWCSEIGQFLHLPEMDKNFVRAIDNKIIEASSRNYMRAVIAGSGISDLIDGATPESLSIDDVGLIDRLISNCESLRKDILGLKGHGDLFDPGEIEKVWLKELKDLSMVTEQSIEEWLDLAYWQKLGLDPLLPKDHRAAYCLARILKREGKAKVTPAVIEGAIADITQLRQRLHRLLVIDKILETREAMERVFFSHTLSFRSMQALKDSLFNKIASVRLLYGDEAWSDRVAQIKAMIEQRFSGLVAVPLVALLFDSSLHLTGLGNDPYGQRFPLDVASFENFCNSFTFKRTFSIPKNAKKLIEIAKNGSPLICIGYVNQQGEAMLQAENADEKFSSKGISLNQLELDLANPVGRALLASVLLSGIVPSKKSSY